MRNHRKKVFKDGVFMQKIVETDQSVIDEVERTKWKRVLITLAKDWRLYVLLIPVLVFMFCFKYLPIGGILLGFKWGDGTNGNIYNDFWNGFRFIEELLAGSGAGTFWKAFRNTFVNSMYGLILGFPIPILLALLFSEVKNQAYRSFLQVACYLPHFVSLVVVTSIVSLWCKGPNSAALSMKDGGVFYQLCVNLGLTDKSNGMGLLSQPKFFRPIYQISGIWEGAGYGSIVYFAAICAISPTSYEAARIDGASKLQQIRYVTFPGMAPTLTIMLIMRVGQILNVGYEKIILLIGTETTAWETGDVISTYVYRQRAGNAEGGVKPVPQMGVVADLFNALIAMCLILGANAISRRVSSTSLF